MRALVAALLCAISLQCATALRSGPGDAQLRAPSGGGGLTAGARPQLRFRPDGTFRILQLTDLHYGEDDHLDAPSDTVQATVLAAERPDLVIFSGDMVSGWACGRPPRPTPCAPGWFEARWRQLIAPVHAAGLPYAITLGNHDAEADLTRRQIVGLDVRTGGPLTLTRQGPPQATGASNFYLDILGPATSCGNSGSGSSGSSTGERSSGSSSSAGEDSSRGGGSGGTSGGAQPAAGGNATAARVWLLDSMDRTCPPLNFGWGCVASDALAWVRDAAGRLPAVPSLAFVHIPIPQFMDVWAHCPTVGRRQEDVACSVRDTGLFGLAKQVGIHAIYSGHDHNSEWAGSTQGIRLAYGRKSGYGGYGPPEGWLRGARVIELRLGEDTAVSKTWIRQEDGSVVVQTPSEEPKDMRQLICHCDEFEQQPGMKQQLLATAGGSGEAAAAAAAAVSCSAVPAEAAALP